MNQPREPVPIHVAVAEDVAVTHGYDQVIIVARLPGNPGKEWVTTWGRDPVNKQAAAVIGKAVREGVMAPLEELRGLLRETLPMLPGFGVGERCAGNRNKLIKRIEAALAPVVLETPPGSLYEG